MTEQPHDGSPSGYASIRFIDRIRYLIKTDPDMTVAECIGCLFMVAHEVAACAFEEEE